MGRVTLRKHECTAYWNGVKPMFLCGHEGAKSVNLVKYSAGGILHLLCSSCLKEGIWLAQKVTKVIHMKTGDIYS